MVNKSSSFEHIPLPTLRRLPYYYNILCNYQNNGYTYVSSSLLAKHIGIDSTLVRKDIALTGYIGRPKVGFNTTDFKIHLEKFLKMDKLKEVVIIGAGNLGTALCKYDGFKIYGLNIVEAFDRDPTKIGNKIGDIPISHISKLSMQVKKRDIKIAIIATTGENAQDTANILVESGIISIWNFAPVFLNVPETVFVWNENLAASFIALSQFIN